MAYDTGETRQASGGDSQRVLDDVFDDPEHGDVGRDRMGVHFAWEAMLAVTALILGIVLYSQYADVVSGVQLEYLLVFASALGLLTFAAAMSLRVGAVNLAIGPIAAAAAISYADHSEQGLVPAAVMASAVALIVGVGLAIMVVGFHVPAWAGSLAAACVTIVWIQKQPGQVEVIGQYAPGKHALYLIAAFGAVSIAAGLLGAIKTVRRGLGRFRPVADPSVRRGGFAAAMAALGMIGSSVLAALGGVLLAALAGEQDLPVAPGLGLDLTALAIGAAMIGGVSAFGRRGGVFGTLLAVSITAMFLRYQEAANWRISHFALGAGAIVIGLIVTRLVETFGRPLPIDDNDWSDVGVSGTNMSWSTGSGDTWSNLPAHPAGPSSGWKSGADDRWSSIG